MSLQAKKNYIYILWLKVIPVSILTTTRSLLRTAWYRFNATNREVKIIDEKKKQRNRDDRL